MNRYLKSFIPMALGAGLAATGIGAPLAAAMVGGGAALRARKVDDASGGNALLSGISAGMGAYGGANLMGGLQALGSAPTAGAPGALSTTEAAARPAMVQTGTSTPSGLAGFGGEPPVPVSTYDFASVPSQTPWHQIETGFGKTLTDPGAYMQQMGGLKGLATNAGMAAAPVAMEAMQPKEMTPFEQAKGNLYGYDYDPNAQAYGTPQSSEEQTYFKPRYTLTSMRSAAEGGIMQLAQGGSSSLGGYSDGGRLLRGPGDGVSDSIPASIEGQQPARLADGEFVIPAFDVATLGNGSTEAGARKLYAMLQRLESARKKTDSGTDAKAERHLPA